MKFDYSLEPGKKLINENYVYKEPIISVIMPFYNDGEYIEQTINCMLNQTYPYFEILIVDDGSTDKKSLKKLEIVEKLDKRIRVLHKNNGGPSQARDYASKKCSNSVKYFLFLDSDDLLERTYLECAYWTLETNKEASWTYSDSVGFQAIEYIWNKHFDSEKMKENNELSLQSLVRKDAFFEVDGFGLKEKSVNEDWNFWLKLISKGHYPVHMSFYGQWYRRKNVGELKRSIENKEQTLEIINETIKTIKKPVYAIEYPKYDYNFDIINEEITSVIVPKREKNEKTNILMIIPWMVTGGADKFNLDLIKRINKNKFTMTVITTECNINVLRQEFEQYADVYDLTSFLDQKNWLSFINYIIEKNNINVIFNSNSLFGYSILPYLKGKYPNIPILDYVHMEEWYYRNGGYSRYASIFSEVIDKTLVCNNSTAKILSNYFKKSSNEVETVYIGVDEKYFDPLKYDDKEILTKYKLDNNNKFIISYICRIAPQKRPFLMFEIIKKVLSKRNDVLFLIVGDGEFLYDFKQKVKANDLSENVKFLGNITEVEEIYKISTLTLNCSIKEGLALTSYESLSMGVPVITSDVGGQAELINDKVGKVVKCYQDETDIYDFNYKDEEINLYVNAINEILAQPDFYKNNCRKRILNGFTLDKMIKNMEEIFTNCKNQPNKEKIENGKSLSRVINITKELITTNFANDENRIRYQAQLYNNKVYGDPLDVNSTLFNRFKNRMWQYKPWRWFVNTPVWKIPTKALKKLLK